MVTAVKRARPNDTTVMLDRETVARLKEAAGGIPLAVFLRELSLGLAGQVSTPHIPLMAKLEQILDDHTTILDTLKYLQTIKKHEPAAAPTVTMAEVKPMVAVENESGEIEMMPAHDFPDIASAPQASGEDLKVIFANLKAMARSEDNAADKVMLDEYDKEHPENTPGDCGFYHRDAPGKWHFIKEREKKAYREVDREKDAITAYFDAVALKRIKPIPERIPKEYLGDSDEAFRNRFLIHSQHRQEIIQAGFKLLAEKKKRRKVARQSGAKSKRTP